MKLGFEKHFARGNRHNFTTHTTSSKSRLYCPCHAIEQQWSVRRVKGLQGPFVWVPRSKQSDVICLMSQKPHCGDSCSDAWSHDIYHQMPYCAFCLFFQSLVVFWDTVQIHILAGSTCGWHWYVLVRLQLVIYYILYIPVYVLYVCLRTLPTSTYTTSWLIISFTICHAV